MNFFPACDAPREHAITNPLAVRPRGREFAGTKALARSSLEPDAPTVPCCGSLAMGNLNATTWAQGAHAGVLRQRPEHFADEGVMRPHAPFP